MGDFIIQIKDSSEKNILSYDEQIKPQRALMALSEKIRYPIHKNHISSSIHPPRTSWVKLQKNVNRTNNVFHNTPIIMPVKISERRCAICKSLVDSNCKCQRPGDWGTNRGSFSPPRECKWTDEPQLPPKRECCNKGNKSGNNPRKLEEGRSRDPNKDKCECPQRRPDGVSFVDEKKSKGTSKSAKEKQKAKTQNQKKRLKEKQELRNAKNRKAKEKHARDEQQTKDKLASKEKYSGIQKEIKNKKVRLKKEKDRETQQHKKDLANKQFKRHSALLKDQSKRQFKGELQKVERERAKDMMIQRERGEKDMEKIQERNDRLKYIQEKKKAKRKALIKATNERRKFRKQRRKEEKEHVKLQRKRRAAALKFLQRKRGDPFTCPHPLYLYTLKRRPCMWVYYLMPRFYPVCLHLLNLWYSVLNALLFLAAMIFWTPCILFVIACKSLVCCLFCID